MIVLNPGTNNLRCEKCYPTRRQMRDVGTTPSGPVRCRGGTGRAARMDGAKYEVLIKIIEANDETVISEWIDKDTIMEVLMQKVWQEVMMPYREQRWYKHADDFPSMKYEKVDGEGYLMGKKMLDLGVPLYMECVEKRFANNTCWADV